MEAEARTAARLVDELLRIFPSYAVLAAPFVADDDLALHERLLAGAAAEEIAQGRGEGLREVFEAVERLYPERPASAPRREGPCVLMDALLDALLTRGVDHAQVEALLPPGLHRCWGIAQDDRFCPPHDGFW